MQEEFKVQVGDTFDCKCELPEQKKEGERGVGQPTQLVRPSSRRRTKQEAAGCDAAGRSAAARSAGRSPSSPPPEGAWPPPALVARRAQWERWARGRGRCIFRESGCADRSEILMPHGICRGEAHLCAEPVSYTHLTLPTNRIV